MFCNKQCLKLTVIMFFGSAANGAAVVEKNGRFEINWSTGKVRFYGTSVVTEGDETWRAAEQRAWSDGLSYLQSNLPQALQVGLSEAGKVTNATTASSSLHTTYFGDRRIKVSLEADLQTLVRQMTQGAAAGQVVAPADGNILLKLGNSSTPTAVFSVVDESGAVLVASSDMAASVQATATLPRWFKVKATAPDASADFAAAPEVKATAVSPGVLRVNRADWQPHYAKLIANGRAAVVIP